MRSSNQIITIYKSPKMGLVPGYLQLIQRHYEKERPRINIMGGKVELDAPVDFLRLSTGSVLDNIIAVKMVYRGSR